MQIIERRARKHIRQWGLTRKTKVLVIEDSSCASALTKVLVEKLITLPHVTFSDSEKPGYDLTLYPICADDAAEELLEHFLRGSNLSEKKSLLIDTTQEEIAQLAPKLGCAPASHSLLDAVKKTQPDAAAALAKSARFLKK